MSLAMLGRRFGNKLYRFAFPVYRPLYCLFKSCADRAERKLLARNLSHGSVVIDAGANIGVYSEFLAKCVGSTGAVHSFEPDPANFERLYRALSNRTNVRLNQLAVSDQTRESVLYISEELNVDHRLYPPRGESRRTVTVGCSALDDYMPPGNRIDLIKIDIQGHELHALKGAERVLADNPDILLLLEFWPYGLKQAGYSGDELVTFLRERGFSLFVFGNNGLTPWERPAVDASADETRYYNIFAQRREDSRSARSGEKTHGPKLVLRSLITAAFN
jgi:FkbM family methyltransferase